MIPLPNEITAVAIDKDKHSQWAVKWTVDNLLSIDPYLILIHVRVRNLEAPTTSTAGPESTRNKFENDVKQLFLPFRGFCARKGVRIKEVVLDDVDVAEAIVAYIEHNCIRNIVVGASTRGFLQSWAKKTADVPTTITRSAPDFCSVYVIAKGKTVTIKTASRHLPANAPQIKTHSSPVESPSPLVPEYSVTEEIARRNWRSEGSDRRLSERHKDIMRTYQRERQISSPRSPSTPASTDNIFTPKSAYSNTSNSGVSDYSSSGYQSSDRINSREFSNIGGGNSSATMIDIEMKRLKMELQQTMDMYSSACKEAVSAKHKALEFQKWKRDEARKFENAKLAEETELSLAKMEMAKTRAALETAEASKRLALLEAKRRKDVEMKAVTEEEEKSKVLNALARGDIRYRKYDLEDIKMSTDNFSDSLKIGEGGYGPVYKAYLDHTPVAVKVLRSDAVQGMKQFQQEVEVLSCIRHPNMVLLLGACPESGCLVYEYMDNGSLEDRLFRKGGTPPIPLWSRFKIAAEIATGLLFLHQTKPEPLVHRDLKPGNILLDQNYVSKISDVGLARLVPPSVANTVTQYHMTAAAGTFCYIDPEYQQTGMLGTKSDIYSLGIMLLQIITARPPMGLAHHVERAIERGNLQDLLDPTVPDWPIEEALSYAKMALRCAELRKRDRPDLDSEILPELSRLRSLHCSESSSLRFSSASNTSSSSSHQKSSNASQERMRSSPTSGMQYYGEDEFNSPRKSFNEEGNSQLENIRLRLARISSDEGSF